MCIELKIKKNLKKIDFFFIELEGKKWRGCGGIKPVNVKGLTFFINIFYLIIFLIYYS
jgi:hypothetical protein